MEGFIPCAGTVSQDISCEACESQAYDLTCEKPHREYKQCSCDCMKETVKSSPLGALNFSSIGKDGDLIVREVGSSLGVILHVHDNHNTHGESPGLDATSDQDVTADSNEIKVCQEFYQTVSLDEKVEKGLSKCATFPSSVGMRQREGLPNTTVQGPHPSVFESPSYSRSMSLPTSLKLVSAMKGGRVQNRKSPDVELRVKWAPEVRDPPSTSMSHTVRSHHHYQQRTKTAKKSGNKHKKNKGKSSRGSGGERKNTNCRRIIGNMPDPLLNMRLQANGSRLIVDGYAKSSVNVEVYAVNGQEEKCRSIFLREEGLGKVHLSIAEAS